MRTVLFFLVLFVGLTALVRGLHVMPRWSSLSRPTMYRGFWTFALLFASVVFALYLLFWRWSDAES